MKITERLKRITSIAMVALILVVQPGAMVLADTGSDGSTPAADPAPTTTTDPAPTDTTPTQDPGTSTQPTTTTTTPAPTSQTPTPAPAASTTPAPTSTPTTTPAQGPQGQVGATGGPTGVKPNYAFNDATRKWEPTIQSSFTWSASAQNWVSPFYRYEPVVGWWHVVQGVTPSSAITALTAGSSNPTGLLNQILGINDPSNTNTGPGSTNSGDLNVNNALLATLLNNLSITNTINQNSLSGDATVGNNTNGGDATTGAASVVNNLLNLLNAMWTFSTGGLSYFVDNIMGNQTGDIVLNPQANATTGGQLGGGTVCTGGLASNATTGPGSTNTAADNCTSDVNVNAQTTGNITNNVNMGATSGNATVANNTNGGSAMSGDARAELNIVNLINSAIGSAQSFFGIINIYGNLNGDILFPGLNLNGAVASSTNGGGSAANTNTGPDSTNTATQNNDNNTTVNNDVNGAFNNNINATATSGTANVSNNTTAGNATTGTASTNSSLFNLFNSSIFGDNAVLVIINNMGHWVGRLMNLGVSGDSGGGLLTSNATVQNNNTGPDSNNSATVNNTNNGTLNNTVNGTINNNVTVNATSGDADVSNNTHAGDATTGNATVASNIANIFGSSLNFNHVFGILFVNVFGDWTGSVGEDTAAGNVQPMATFAAVIGSGSGPAAVVTGAFTAGAGEVAHLAGIGGSNNSNASSSAATINSGNGANSLQAIASAAHLPQGTAKAAARGTGLLFILMAAAFLLAGAAYQLERRTSLKR